MKKLAYIGSAALGMTAVIMGAFGAHALEETLLANDTLSTYETGARYHMYHALLLLGLGVVAEFGTSSWLRLSVWFALAGVLIFSGTLYVLAILNLRWLGAVTPVGGLLLILSWGSLLIHIIKRKPNP
jgi:uncharacterized membrane protein YgdD (TMEM256/DUF423 family)